MSDLFDEEPDEPATRRPGRRARALVITGGILLVGFFALTAFAAIYTDRLWYREVGYSQVFSTMLWTRVGLFLVFGVFMGAAVAVNMHLAYRFRPLFRMPGADSSVDRYRDAVTPIRTWLLIGVAIVVGGFAGTSAVGQWRTYLLWRNGQPWGQEDAHFGRDIGFYVFDLPWWHYVVDFVMAAAVVALIATAVVHYLYGGIRLQVQHDRLSGAAQVQFSVLLGIFVLAKAVDYYLDRFDLVTDDHNLFTGMNYTGENALLPARNILLGVAVICAILFFLNVWRRTWQLPSVGLALLALSAILLGMVWPAIVQNFQVKPSEADKENAYIEANIAATREAFGLDNVETESFSSSPESVENVKLADLTAQLTQVPVVDPQQVRQTFEQRQQRFAYYSVPPVLDVDRYRIEDPETGRTAVEPLVLGLRELDQDGIEPGDRNWSNLHTVYTHGEGIIAAYANRISEDEENGRMVWAEGIEDAENVFSGGDAEIENRIYYGEDSPSYSIVGKASDDSEDVELGLNLNSDPESEEESTTTYDGEGGVPVGGAFNQLMYAMKFGEPNFLLSGRVNGNSKVIYNRDPQERVEAVAPWLTVDSDPYPAVIDGRIQWILDGYTTTDRYPNAQRESFEEMTDDALAEDTGFQTIPTDEINYMRSAVKATVDAYDGTVTLYAWDESDPILSTWMSAFPDSVQPYDAIPDSLMEHLRYPEDLFKVQRYQLAKYHVTDAGEFYQGSDLWDVAPDPNVANTFQPPYRVFTGDGQWSMTSVFVPNGRGTVASFAAVNSDATSQDFGKIRLLEMTDANAPAPGQVANEMEQNEDVRTELLPYLQEGSTPPIYGNLLTLPVDDGLIYIEPVYAVRTSESGYPILQNVIVYYGERVGVGENLILALADALGADPDDLPDGGEGQGNGNGGPDGNNGENPPELSIDEQIANLLQRAQDAFDAAAEAQQAGDTEEWARQIEIAEDYVADAVALAERRDAAADETADEPTDGQTDGQAEEPTDGETGE